MGATRRDFLTGAVGAAIATTATTRADQGDQAIGRPKVIFFDVNETLLDLKPLREAVGKALGGRPELVPLWFTTMLQYFLVTTVADRYANFGDIAVACLRMVGKSHGVELGDDEVTTAVAPIRSLPAHPEVATALKRLKDAKYRLATLTNSSRDALADQLQNAGLAELFEANLSVEDVGLYKPHAHVYRWAARRMAADVTECLLVAAHGWDVAGASWAGMRSAFVGRPGQQPFPLGPKPELSISTLKDLADELVR